MTIDTRGFVLDKAENPHPRMLAAAQTHLRRSRRWWARRARRDWRIYRAAMSDATGESPASIEAWVDRHG